jgi:hypothetical protein
VIAGAVLLREKPLWSGGPGLLELEDRNGHDKPEARKTHSMDLTPPGAQSVQGQLRSWFERWWSPDPRKAPRVKEPGLAAYYWNGAAPVAHGVRDISSSGLYVVTEERWYPGTLVLMTLQRTDHGEECGAIDCRAIAGRALGSGRRGVAVYSVRRKDMRSGKTSILDAATREEFDLFLAQLNFEG